MAFTSRHTLALIESLTTSSKAMAAGRGPQAIPLQSSQDSQNEDLPKGDKQLIPPDGV
jgi:hypothetical protein